MRLDVAMWTRNGSKNLEKVLKAIDVAIPKGVLHKKILVDDHSEDDTVSIARQHGWEVFPNPARGIASGANEALRHVDCPFFASVEQDVVLAKDWFTRIFPYVKQPGVLVAQGIRLSRNTTIQRLERYLYERDQQSMSSMKEPYTSSLDNNIFNTYLLMGIGGFPEGCMVCTDKALTREVFQKRYKWVVDYGVVSEHLDKSPQKYYRQMENYVRLCGCQTGKLPSFLRNLITSPLTGTKMAQKRQHLSFAWFYPTMCLYKTKGLIEKKLCGI